MMTKQETTLGLKKWRKQKSLSELLSGFAAASVIHYGPVICTESD